MDGWTEIVNVINLHFQGQIILNLLFFCLSSTPAELRSVTFACTCKSIGWRYVIELQQNRQFQGQAFEI